MSGTLTIIIPVVSTTSSRTQVYKQGVLVVTQPHKLECILPPMFRRLKLNTIAWTKGLRNRRIKPMVNGSVMLCNSASLWPFQPNSCKSYSSSMV